MISIDLASPWKYAPYAKIRKSLAASDQELTFIGPPVTTWKYFTTWKNCITWKNLITWNWRVHGQIQQQGVISNLHRSITYFDSPPLSFLKSISSLVFVHFHLTNSGYPAKKNQLKTSIEPFFKCFRACFVVYLLCIQNVSSWFLLTAECPKAYNLHFPSLNTAFLTYIPETRFLRILKFSGFLWTCN